MPLCIWCLNELHSRCGGCDCGTCNKSSENSPENPTGDSDEEITDSEESEDDEKNWRRRGATVRRHKRDAAVQDAASTGRKRAAKMYPLDRNAACEWLGKQNVGGGNYPIAGCPVERACTQQARHHGPDKNTLNNEEGNVHRIGHLCHNRWHARNDPEYNLDNLGGRSLSD